MGKDVPLDRQGERTRRAASRTAWSGEKTKTPGSTVPFRFVSVAPSFTGSVEELATSRLIRTPRGRTRVVGGSLGTGRMRTPATHLPACLASARAQCIAVPPRSIPLYSLPLFTPFSSRLTYFVSFLFVTRSARSAIETHRSLYVSLARVSMVNTRPSLLFFYAQFVLSYFRPLVSPSPLPRVAGLIQR